jgi:hypothetical protein
LGQLLIRASRSRSKCKVLSLLLLTSTAGPVMNPHLNRSRIA